MTTPVTSPIDLITMSDGDLVERVLQGDIDAYEGIMRHHNQRLFRIARSIVTDDAEAMDVVQDAFVTAFEKLKELRSPEALPLWLSRIVRNSALMRLRKNRRIEYLDEPDVENVVTLSVDSRRPERPEHRIAQDELRSLLEVSIDRLPAAFRTVFMLRAVEKCSVSETAAVLEINEATVKTRYHRARLLLQDYLMDYSAQAGVPIHEFAGDRCDRVVRFVLGRIKSKSG